jgi:gem associated protein 7
MFENGSDNMDKDPRFPPDFSSVENQEARAFLRERFLTALTGIAGKDCQFRMFDNTKFTAEFRGSDVDVMHLCVRQLKAPLGDLPEAIVRTSDIIRMHLHNIDKFGNI